MATSSQQTGFATGIDRTADDLRRRNLQSNQQYRTGSQPQDIKEKSKEKVCILQSYHSHT